MPDHGLIYDWNEAGERWEKPAFRVQLDDETLRDGLQSPVVRNPSTPEKIEILHLMDGLGIDSADLGLPGAGPPVAREVTRLAQEIGAAGLGIRPNCAARPLREDIVPIVEISQRAGIAIEVCLFVGSSPIRQFAEGWTLERMRHRTEEAVGFAVAQGLAVTCVTEDTARAHPEALDELLRAAIESGAARLCLCDTVGHATPTGVANLVGFARETVRRSGADVALDWHGHADRGLAVANALSAIRAGASRVHGCALGLGERAGNAPLDLLLVNLRLLGWIDNDLSSLEAYCRRVSETVEVPIPDNYPVVGRNAFRSGTGMHASAMVKALRKGEEWLADRVYSGVPATLVGRRPEIEIGPLSGTSNAVWWLESRGIASTPERAEALVQRARSEDRVLTGEEIRATIESLEETSGS